jgi:hypothetical protein
VAENTKTAAASRKESEYSQLWRIPVTTVNAEGKRLWKTYGAIESTAYNHHAKITYSAILVA